jgi:hypothetical protein
VNTYNIITLWYLAGLYLILVGWFLLADDGDIFIGFLWVIDLGVGLVFFIFILHYSNFLHQKALVEKSGRDVSFLLLFLALFLALFFVFSQPIDTTYFKGLDKSWFFYLSWYDYYDFFYLAVITDLNLLKELYFVNNGFEFFLINFVLFYGIVSAVLLLFLTKRVFAVLNLTQVISSKFLTKVNAMFFIRTQDFLKQQLTTNGSRIWIKKKHQTI